MPAQIVLHPFLLGPRALLHPEDVLMHDAVSLRPVTPLQPSCWDALADEQPENAGLGRQGLVRPQQRSVTCVLCHQPV